MTNYQLARQQFATKLRQLRQEQNMTQEKLAELLGKTTEHISFLERAERSPSFETLFDLSNVLNVPVSTLLEDPARSINLSETLGIQQFVASPPEPINDSQPVKQQQISDLERLNKAFIGIREAQLLADEYGINDILQDNGGKVLQVLILLGLRISPGREGNDAIDSDGNEYELKTINRALRKSAGVTTHHHLTKEIIDKYRAVKAWFIAIYEGVELKEIYKVLPTNLEPLFHEWEQRSQAKGPLNNPKIPMRYILSGEKVYPLTNT